MKDKKKIFKTRVLPIGLIVLNVIVFTVEQVIAGFFNTEWYETLILIGVGLLFTFFAWFIVAWFVREIVQALEELPEEEVQKIQKQAGIIESERCVPYTDVCSITRALRKPGLNIPFDQKVLDKYRLYTHEQFLKVLDNEKYNIYIFSNDAFDAPHLIDQYIVSKEYAYTKGHDVYEMILDCRHDPKAEEMLALSHHVIKLPNSHEDIDSLVLSITSLIVLQKHDKPEDIQSYLMYPKKDFKAMYYKLPNCMNKAVMEFVTRKTLRLSNKKGQVKDFIIRPLDSGELDIVLKLQNDVLKDNISKDLFVPPAKEEIADSLKNDLVLGVFSDGKLVAFMIYIIRDDKNRNLSYFINAKYDSHYVTIDNAEVRKEYRGYGLEKMMLEYAETKYPHHKFVAVVSKNNIYSYRNFMALGYKDEKVVEIYSSTRRLVIK